MFDDAFIRAARITELSARERMAGTSHGVRPRYRRRAGHPQAWALLLIVLAFAAAVYFGIRHSHRPAEAARPDRLRITLVPLEPPGPVPAASADRLFTAAGAARYRVGADGVTLPPVRATEHFSEPQVLQALSAAKDYLVASSLDPAALTGGDVRGVRELLTPGQLDQFDDSLARPADDGLHAVTGWMVRFDPARISLADPRVRVQGAMAVSEHDGNALEVSSDHTLVYAVRATGARQTPPSLFTVRRQLRMAFTSDDLRLHQMRLVQASVTAGPLSCAADFTAYFRPLLAGQSPPSAPGADPYDRRRPATSVCGQLRVVPMPAAGR